jgi:hypothetical protein
VDLRFAICGSMFFADLKSQQVRKDIYVEICGLKIYRFATSTSMKFAPKNLRICDFRIFLFAHAHLCYFFVLAPISAG